MRYATAAAAFIGAVLANPLTIIDPCPQRPDHHAEITVTKQYQEVPYCVPTSTCDKKSCVTRFPMHSSVYVSTVIPCAVDGTKASVCTVTKTDQVVPCSESASTITKVVPVKTTRWHDNTKIIGVSMSTAYKTVHKEWSVPFNKLGPLAIPGYGGSGLCKDCDKKADGSRGQDYEINECRVDNGGAPVCQAYKFHYISKAAPSATSPARAICSSKVSVNKPGVYTYTFPQVAPATTIYQGGKTYVISAQPWWAHVTKTAHGPTRFDFTVTVRKTITYRVPYPKTPERPQYTKPWNNWGNWPSKPQPPKQTHDKPWNDWNNWPRPTTKKNDPWNNWPKQTTKKDDPSKPTDSWNDWNNWVPTSTTGKGGPTPPPGDDKCVIKVVTGSGRYHKRSDIKYIGFPDGDDGETVDVSSAAYFSFDRDGELRTGWEFINRNGKSGYIPFEKAGYSSGGKSKFQGGKGQQVTLPGASFCVAGDAVIINFGSSPSGCVPAWLYCVDKNESTTTTTMSITTTKSTYSTTSTTTYSEPETTTTTTADVSADPEVPDPTPEPGTGHKPRGLIY